LNRATIAQGTRPSRQLPQNTRTRLQYLLDQGDALFFANNPHERARRRMYFCGERVHDHGTPSRYITVRIAIDGGLVRRFEHEGGGE